MKAKFYNFIKASPRQLTTLPSHFPYLYGGLKQAFRELSLQAGATECPVELR
jgi:hypothetical protein